MLNRNDVGNRTFVPGDAAGFVKLNETSFYCLGFERPEQTDRKGQEQKPKADSLCPAASENIF
jgi:hypothetical protein